MNKILIITRNFPPLWGGMERLNWHLADQLARHSQVRLIAPQGAAEHAPPGITVREVPLRPLRQFIIHAALAARREAAQWQPDLILAGSGLTAPMAWLAARRSHARTAAYVHGLDLTATHPIYRALWRPALRRMHTVIANSQPTARLAEGIGIHPERIRIVHPGVEIPTADATARARFRAQHGLDEHTPVLLSVGRLTARKGLREFVRDVLPTIVQHHPNAQLLVIGEVPANALHAEAQTPHHIQAAANAAGVDKNLKFLGTRFGQDLSDALFAADVHVFPVRTMTNDPEGFGMVAIEAAAHGLPTVAYATGGVVDAVAEGISGRLVPPGDAAGFAQAVNQLLSHPQLNEATRAFAEGFAWPVFGQQLKKALNKSTV